MRTDLDDATNANVLQRIGELRGQGVKYQDITDSINREFGLKMTRTAVKLRYRYYQQNPMKVGPSEPDGDDTFLARCGDLIRTDKRWPKDPSVDDVERIVLTAQEVRQDLLPDQMQAAVTIKTDQPIALSFISDVHIGSGYVNYRAFFDDLRIIRSDPRFFLAAGGDWADKFMPSFKDASASTWQIVPAELQLLFTQKILKALEPSIVACIGGNHNDMDMKLTGISTDRMIHRDGAPAFMPHGGLLTLTVGQATYRIIWKHHWRYNSALNQFNSHHRILEQLAPSADIVVTEHEHNPGMESIERFEYDDKRTIINVRTGAYKENDAFSMKYFKGGRRGPQTLILWPDRSEPPMAIHGGEALRRAQTFLNGWSQKGDKRFRKETIGKC